jgi:hypothetical protein
MVAQYSRKSSRVISVASLMHRSGRPDANRREALEYVLTVLAARLRPRRSISEDLTSSPRSQQECQPPTASRERVIRVACSQSLHQRYAPCRTAVFAASAPSRTRTCGLLLRRQSLYPPELSGLAVPGAVRAGLRLAGSRRNHRLGLRGATRAGRHPPRATPADGRRRPAAASFPVLGWRQGSPLMG